MSSKKRKIDFNIHDLSTSEPPFKKQKLNYYANDQLINKQKTISQIIQDIIFGYMRMIKHNIGVDIIRIILLYYKVLIINAIYEDIEYINNLGILRNISIINQFKYIKSFIQSNIYHKNWRCRDAALSVFHSTLYSPNTDLISSMIPIILNLMNDKHITVRINAMNTFANLCNNINNLPKSIININILQHIIKGLNEKESKIVNNACWCIAELSEYFGTNNIRHCMYKNENIFYNLIKELLGKNNQTNSNQNCMIISIHEAINSLIYYAPDDNDLFNQKIHLLFNEFIKDVIKYTNLININKNISDIHKISGLLSCIQTITYKVQYFNENVTEKIMKLCCLILQYDPSISYNELQQESLECISCISSVIGNRFLKYFDNNLLQTGLIKSITLNSTSKSIPFGAACIGDVYRVCGDYLSTNDGVIKFQSFTDNVVSKLLAILNDGKNDLVLLSHIVDALQDILMACGKYANRYSFNVLDKCLTIGIKSMLSSDRVSSIMDTCRVCLIQLDQSEIEMIIPKLHSLFNAIDNKNESGDIIESCVGLVREVEDYWDIKFVSQLKIDSVTNILNKAKDSITQT